MTSRLLSALLVSSSSFALLVLSTSSRDVSLYHNTILTLPHANNMDTVHAHNWPAPPYEFAVSDSVCLTTLQYKDFKFPHTEEEILDDLAGIAEIIDERGPPNKIIQSSIYCGSKTIMFLHYIPIREPCLTVGNPVQLVHKIGGHIIVFGPVIIQGAYISYEGLYMANFYLFH